MLKITTRVVIAELERRGIKVEVITEAPCALLRYYFKGKWHLLHSSLPESTTGVGRVVCDQKYVATALAKLNDIPVPETLEYSGMPAAINFMKRRKRIVVKPTDSAHGQGITVGVDNQAQLQTAITLAQQKSLNGGVLLQQLVSGSDMRVLVIGGVFVAALRRVPAEVTGDSTHTLRELIQHENQTNPERGTNDEKRLAIIDLSAAERFLGERLDKEVPPKDKIVQVVGTANVGTGGYAVDYTDKAPAAMRAAAERFATAAKVVACGVDFIWDEDSGEFHFIEGNATPGLNMHMQPSVGESRPTAKYFVDFILAQPNQDWHEVNFAQKADK